MSDQGGLPDLVARIPGWPSRFGVQRLDHLADCLAAAVEFVRTYPEHRRGDYFHDVAYGGGVTKSLPNPDGIRRQMWWAQEAINETHLWLERNGVIGQPEWERGIFSSGKAVATYTMDDVGRADAALSKLLNFVRRKAKPEVAKRTRKKAKPRGRRPAPPKERNADKRIFDVWKKGWAAGVYRKYDECGKEFGVSGEAVKAAVDRETKRRKSLSALA